MKKSILSSKLILVLLIITVIFLSIKLYNLTTKLYEIERSNLLEFAHEVQEPGLFIENLLNIENDTNHHLLNIEITELSSEYHHLIGKFHELSPDNRRFFEDIEDYVQSKPSNEKLLKVKDYLYSLDEKITKFHNENKIITNKKWNVFFNDRRKEFNDVTGKD